MAYKNPYPIASPEGANFIQLIVNTLALFKDFDKEKTVIDSLIVQISRALEQQSNMGLFRYLLALKELNAIFLEEDPVVKMRAQVKIDEGIKTLQSYIEKQDYGVGSDNKFNHLTNGF